MKKAVHDIDEESLAWVMSRSNYPDLLDSLVKLSRETFGWFNKSISRAFEYPWILNEIKVSGKSRVLDVGAGISPLPIAIAQQGAKVVTIDSSHIVRKLGDGQESWNGWGFLDYSSLNDNIVSFNEDVFSSQFKESSFDCIYSVSVIEHITTELRRKLWADLSRRLESNGLLLLTIDIIPDTNNLWNCSAGSVVEDVESHGDCEMVKAELLREGLYIEEYMIIRGLPLSKVDISMMRFKKF